MPALFPLSRTRSSHRLHATFTLAQAMTLAFAMALASFAQAAPSPAFVDGDRWVAVGDSITQDGSYARYVELFHVLRRPTDKLTYVNAGISGDSASGALRRFDWDIVPAIGPAPTVATVMLGMNDVGRDLYAAGLADEAAARSRRALHLTNYAQNLRTLVERLQARHVRVILLTPSPYDDSSALPNANSPGVNAALATCADIIRALAAEHDLAVVDLHGPLTALAQHRQTHTPEFTLIGGDRVHPGAAGHFAMAYHLLRAQHRAGPFVQVQLHAPSATARFSRGATIGTVTNDTSGLSFTYLADSLPVPIPDTARDALDWVPFADELNREELRVTDLAPGDYTLAIDERPIATFSSESLARGIDLARFPTPQLRQAKDVLAILEKRWDEIKKQRRLASVEYWFAPDAPRPLDLATMEPLLATWERELSSQPRHWQRKQPSEYRTWKPTEADIATAAAALLDEARAAALPIERRITLHRADSASASASFDSPTAHP